MSRGEAYGTWFCADRADGPERTAERVLPLVFDLARPSSVVDLGCGTGVWTAVAGRLGAETVLGIDGDRAGGGALRIPPDCFLRRDLGHPVRLDGRRFDLALCLEVAEHQPPVRADTLVADLCALSDLVLFAAALPGQPGSAHRNGQWPPYWRDRFRRRGYVLVDCLRSRLWDDPEIEPWCAQNAYLYVSTERLAGDARLREAAAETGRMPLSAVHPGLAALSTPAFAPPVPAPPEQRAAPLRFVAAVEDA
ncbi:methyltransferase domain-containing protein [Streptomyces sp. NPDC002054]|uniref:methyltransferase domain-containing protein n=1 Tax=Streptomyces sp. NPDC002054 TaxID=3154663 RepID=UPI0033224AA2